MTVADALHDPKPCPCGGQYVLVRKGNGVPSLMHSKPPCAAYHSMTPLEFLAMVEGDDSEGAAALTEAPKPNRRQRRSMARAARRAR